MKNRKRLDKCIWLYIKEASDGNQSVEDGANSSGKRTGGSPGGPVEAAKRAMVEEDESTSAKRVGTHARRVQTKDPPQDDAEELDAAPELGVAPDDYSGEIFGDDYVSDIEAPSTYVLCLLLVFKANSPAQTSALVRHREPCDHRLPPRTSCRRPSRHPKAYSPRLGKRVCSQSTHRAPYRPPSPSQEILNRFSPSFTQRTPSWPSRRSFFTDRPCHVRLSGPIFILPFSLR